ncbi:hypothetical protein E2C01_036999 [Portunus trituberculatus]|uniref:Uncharacterized protein n=1 Tax=Portunus trituberculatus TaxID=210409 RepID=A0A5B7FFW2_PORTR|nr:hypothetical protein [Portunus trituberculatus]
MLKKDSNKENVTSRNAHDAKRESVTEHIEKENISSSSSSSSSSLFPLPLPNDLTPKKSIPGAGHVVKRQGEEKRRPGVREERREEGKEGGVGGLPRGHLSPFLPHEVSLRSTTTTTTTTTTAAAALQLVSLTVAISVSSSRTVTPLTTVRREAS